MIDAIIGAFIVLSVIGLISCLVFLFKFWNEGGF